MPNDHQDSEERRQSAVPRMEIGRRQERVGQNQEGGNLPEKRKGDVNLPDVTADGDRNFLEKNFQIQIQSQRNKEVTNRQESVGTHHRREKEGWRELGVFEDYERSVDGNYWGLQMAKKAEKQKECQKVTSLIKIQNGPNEGVETNKEK